ncbi:OCIA domain-containing protein 1-like [Paramacrobiotus metropolitanus]|uniref:OCIA domain-containing protein 1-like n=1 Tax=Paramacrobiotus metropolitanus TaxID=2943436 RepID=UPI002445B661|nr:OCIA domain-containing protein 1-like [Paramacrobiotus metropolitanus]
MKSSNDYDKNQRFSDDRAMGDRSFGNNVYGDNDRSGLAYSNPIDLSETSPRRGFPGASGGQYQQYDKQQPNAPNWSYGGGSPPDQERTQFSNYGAEPDSNYKMTAEENAILKECARESTIKRSLPFAAVFSALTHLAVKKGYLSAHPKYGSMFKVFASGFTGYLLGKLSYYKECEDKFLSLPNSRVADAIRRRRQGKTGLPPPPQQPYPGGSGGYRPVQPTTPLYGYDNQGPARSERSSIYNADDHVSSLDIDSEKNTYQEGRDPEMLSERSFDHGREEASRPSANYDDLRRQHRDAYFRPPQPQPRPDDRSRPSDA